ncbi:hypothetical protein BBJ28_00023079 [Nothophytophthora sp. Chile5]|nr:hypothetical protein BBJ28_00023079 [Nothophytophthora sp. Chile5]
MASVPSGHRGTVEVQRVRSGRWKEMAPHEERKHAKDFDLRAVTEAEALSGIGTYVGGAIGVAQVPPGYAKVWDYGVVVGYNWVEADGTGSLQVTFADRTADVIFSELELQDLAVETYALRPCYRRGVSDIMAAEMRAIHQAAYEHFNGTGRNGTRSSSAILQKLSMNLVDEKQRVPLFDVADTRVVLLSVQHLLDYVFYHEGNRRAPRGLTLGESIFDEGAPSPSAEATEAHASSPGDGWGAGQLSDSEDDQEPADAPPEDVGITASNKRKRGEPAPARTNQREIQLQTRPIYLEEDAEMAGDAEPDTALHGLAHRSRSALVPAGTGDYKGQFRPSSMQTAIHGAIVHGTYSSFSPQLLVETIQSQFENFGFLPHPAVLRGLYSWDFGLRGLSAMHFTRLSTEKKRESARLFDMTDFSLKNTMPQPRVSTRLDDLIEAVDVLGCAANVLFVPMVNDLLLKARRFLLTLRMNESLDGPEALLELNHWLDDRLERFRGCLALRDCAAAAEVQNEFCITHEAYARVVQRVVDQRLTAMARCQTPRKSSTRSRVQSRSGQEISHTKRQKQVVRVPPEVVAALPKHHGKALCMKYLSVQGCPGEGDTCVFDYRGHFVPTTIPPIVAKFIQKEYGGVRKEASVAAKLEGST